MQRAPMANHMLLPILSLPFYPDPRSFVLGLSLGSVRFQRKMEMEMDVSLRCLRVSDKERASLVNFYLIYNSRDHCLEEKKLKHIHTA